MFGDCQVLSSMVGGSNNLANMVSTESLFSSSGLNFMSDLPPFHTFPAVIPKEESMMRGVTKEEEMDSGSGSGHIDGLSCGEEHDNEMHQQTQFSPGTAGTASGKKKRYHRHTARQIQEMEALFKECPHPDDKQRMKLSQDLGLKPRQVKFWFQNRRTQMKAHQDRADNVILRAENESLKNDNFRLQAAIRNVVCPSCGSPAILGEMSFDEQNLRVENARLKEELERLSCIMSRYGNHQLGPLGPTPSMLLPSLDLDMGIYSRNFNQIPPVSCADIIPAPQITDEPMPMPCMIIMEQDKPLILDLAMTAADHLIKICHANEPLWTHRSGCSMQFLNLEEHSRLFHWPVELKQQSGEFRTEASRDSAMVIMNSITLVDAFLDAGKWTELFPCIVSKAKTVQVISSGVSGHGNGCLQLMHAKLQFVSPLVPGRETYFFRYCQQNTEEGTWTVVDFPVDGFQDQQFEASLPWYRRRTSGCIIQDMPNGYSRVIWVEHAELEDKPVHQIFSQFVHSGEAFGATRWVTTLQRQCERLASLMARNISDLGVIPSPMARKNMMKLSQRMIRTFCANISSSEVHSWTALSDSSDDTIRVTTRKNTETGQPNGVILTAVSTTWLPFSHQLVFELLTDEQKRSQIDVLSSSNSFHEVAHIANGSHPRNCVSLLRVNTANNSSQNVELLLQESSTHPSGGSLVVYATIDVDGVQVAMSGDDPYFIPLLPTGFIIFPSVNPNNNNNINAETSTNTGCLLTVGMQVLASAVPSAKLNLSSVTAINNHISNTVNQINFLLSGTAKANDHDDQ